MRTLRLVRNCAFVFFVGLTAFAFEERLLASMGQAIGEACTPSGDGYDCTDCTLGEGFEPDWGASGSCDFSGVAPEDLLQVTADYCQTLMSAFDETCETEYPDWLANWHNWGMPTTDPCYSAASDPECWFTWANAGCDAGANSTWGGECDSFMWCECDS